ncbi:hypothetical protein ACRAKI_14540 [Saccharothrix isguenensis]
MRVRLGVEHRPVRRHCRREPEELLRGEQRVGRAQPDQVRLRGRGDHLAGDLRQVARGAGGVREPGDHGVGPLFGGSGCRR